MSRGIFCKEMLKLNIIFSVVVACFGVYIPEDFVRDNNVFSINLYKELLKSHNENFVFGVFSIQGPLALMASGAQGDTLQQIVTVADLKGSNQQLEKNFERALEEININPEFKVALSDKIFVNNELLLKPSFLKTASDFETPIEKLDKNSRKQISDKPNFWIQLESKNKMALLNNVHIDAKWLQGFERQSAEEMDFHVSTTETIKANMMKVTGYFMISRNIEYGVNMIKLPFKNGRAYLLIVLTDGLKPVNYISENAQKIWTERTYTKEYLTLYLPKFEVSSTLDLIPTFRKMGIVSLFSKADLSGISEEIDNVSMMYQKVQININEQGVSADDSSSVVDNAIIKQSDIKEEPKVLKVDHPFVFGILYDDLSLIFGHIFRV